MNIFQYVIVQPSNGACQLFWEYDPNFDYWKYKLELLKAESEGGPYQKILILDNADILEFVDLNVSGHRYVYNFYTFRFINRFDGSVLEVGPYSKLSNPNRFGVYIQNQVARYLKTGGAQVIIYKLKRHGELCPHVDPITRIPKYSNCTICYDTGYIGGYHYPIYTYAQFGGSTDYLQSLGYTETSPSENRVILPGFPKVEPGDVIIRRDNRRYSILAVNNFELQQSVVLQIANVALVQKGNIIYKLPAKWNDRLAYSSLYKGYVTDIHVPATDYNVLSVSTDNLTFETPLSGYFFRTADSLFAPVGALPQLEVLEGSDAFIWESTPIGGALHHTTDSTTSNALGTDPLWKGSLDTTVGLWVKATTSVVNTSFILGLGVANYNSDLSTYTGSFIGFEAIFEETPTLAIVVGGTNTAMKTVLITYTAGDWVFLGLRKTYRDGLLNFEYFIGYPDKYMASGVFTIEDENYIDGPIVIGGIRSDIVGPDESAIYNTDTSIMRISDEYYISNLIIDNLTLNELRDHYIKQVALLGALPGVETTCDGTYCIVGG